MTADDPFGAHEVLDRADILARFWNDLIVEHAAVSADAEMSAMAARIGELIGEFYQLAGSRSL